MHGESNLGWINRPGNSTLSGLGNAATNDFGESIRQRMPSLDVVIERIPATLEIAIGSFLFSVLTLIPLDRNTSWGFIRP